MEARDGDFLSENRAGSGRISHLSLFYITYGYLAYGISKWISVRLATKSAAEESTGQCATPGLGVGAPPSFG